MDPRFMQPVSREQIVAIIRQRAERNLDQAGAAAPPPPIPPAPVGGGGGGNVPIPLIAPPRPMDPAEAAAAAAAGAGGPPLIGIIPPPQPPLPGVVVGPRVPADLEQRSQRRRQKQEQLQAAVEAAAAAEQMHRGGGLAVFAPAGAAPAQVRPNHVPVAPQGPPAAAALVPNPRHADFRIGRRLRRNEQRPPMHHPLYRQV